MRNSSGLIRRLLTLLGFAGILLCGYAQPAYALLPAHQAVDGCSTCHSLHASPGGTLFAIETDPELLCLSCHGPGGSSSLKVVTHNLAGVGTTDDGYITCNECHNSHNNGQEGGRTNADGTYNVKLVGLTLDYNSSPPLGVSVQILKERVATGLGVLKNVVYNSAVNSADYARADGMGVCNACHGPDDFDPVIALPSLLHNEGQNCSGCHPHDGGFAGAGCTGCHSGHLTGSAGLGNNSPHALDSTGFTCEECHTSHTGGDVFIPNNSAVGINYVDGVNGYSGYNGISLGGTGTTGNTEAEICWNCHDGLTPIVSEWGLNTETNGASFPNYNTGTLSTSNWVATWNGTSGSTAIWSSANFTYKEGNVQSTHSVNDVDGVSGKDVVDDIRCSYCHDVHDTFGGPNDGTGPFLRGSWVGNPYKEDGAPRTDASPVLPGDTADYSAYDVAGKFGAVPRGGTTYNAQGGYFIDQNSGNPTGDSLMDSPDKFAGLCVLCHENGAPSDGFWDASEIDAINKFGTPGNDWVGTNGHAAVVKGGGSSVAVNLFTMAKRHPTTGWAAYTGNGSHKGNPVMAYRNARDENKGTWRTSYWAQGLRGTDGTAYQYSPRVDTAIRQYNYGVYNWGGATVVTENADGTMSDSGIDSNFHQFTCSKCHNPHASRLPRLLITNCLDTNHNTWDNAFTTVNDTSLAVENRSVSFSQATSAQNCHRLADPNYPQAGPQGTDPPASGGENGGWNRVTPWVEFP